MHGVYLVSCHSTMRLSLLTVAALLCFLSLTWEVQGERTVGSVCVTENCKTSLVGQKAMMLSTSSSRTSAESLSYRRLIDGFDQVEQREILIIIEEWSRHNTRAFMGNEATRSQSVSGDYETLATVAFSLAIVFFSCAIIYLIVRITCVIRRSE